MSKNFFEHIINLYHRFFLHYEKLYADNQSNLDQGLDRNNIFLTIS